MLVLESTVEGFSGLFSLEERKVYENFRDKLSLQAQTLFARMITRKRIWYSVRDHLSNYGEFEELQPALQELLDHGFILCPESIHQNLIE